MLFLEALFGSRAFFAKKLVLEGISGADPQFPHHHPIPSNLFHPILFPNPVFLKMAFSTQGLVHKFIQQAGSKLSTSICIIKIQFL
jgi:hypothetical protein